MTSISRTRIDPHGVRRVASAAAVALVSLVATPSFAQTKAADLDFEAGRALMDKGRFAEACAKFQASYDASHSAGRALNLSSCEDQQGHLVKAMSWLDQAVGQLAPDDGRVTGAKAKRDELEGRLAKVVVKRAPNAPSDTTFAIGPTLLREGARTPVDPGRATIVARAPGRKDGATDITLAEGELQTFELAPGPPGAGTAPPSPPTAVEPPLVSPTTQIESPTRPAGRAPTSTVDRHRGSAQRIAGWVSLAVGGASLIGAGVTGGVMLAKNGEVHSCGASGDRACTNAEKPGAADARKLGASLAAPNAILWGVGIAGVALCPIVVLTAPHDTATVSAIPSIGPSNWGLSFDGSF